MHVWIIVAVILAFAAAIGVYSYPYWLAELSPSGQITIGALSQLIGMAIEIAVIVKLISALEERRWLPTKKFLLRAIAEQVDEATTWMNGALELSIGHSDEVKLETVAQLRRARECILDRGTETKILLTGNALGPEATIFAANYISVLHTLQDQLRDEDDFDRHVEIFCQAYKQGMRDDFLSCGYRHFFHAFLRNYIDFVLSSDRLNTELSNTLNFRSDLIRFKDALEEGSRYAGHQDVRDPLDLDALRATVSPRRGKAK